MMFPARKQFAALMRLFAWATWITSIYSRHSKKKLHEDNQFAILHIPKCAGTSFEMDVRALLKKNGDSRHAKTLYNTETCFVNFYHKENYNVVFLRNPRAHVLSQFLECKYDDWGKEVTKNSHFPRKGPDEKGFKSWTSFFADDWEPSKGHFDCYNPINMQTRYLALEDEEKKENSWDYRYRCHWHPPQPVDLKDAQHELLKFDLVGVVEFYSAFLCVISYHLYGDMPEECDCEVEKELKMRHAIHGVPSHSWQSHSSDVLRKVDHFTKDDKILYEQALRMFLFEAGRVEKATKKSIICEDAITAAREQLSYMNFKKPVPYISEK